MPSQTSSLNTAIINIREFFWPLLEKATPEIEEENPAPIILKISDECLDQAFDLQLKVVEAEDDRRKSIESKAALFIGTISVTSSVVVAASALLIANNAYTIQIKLFVILSCLLSLYTVRTVWYSVKALERGNYVSLGLDDINFSSTKSDYAQKVILTLEKANVFNQATINLKADYLTLAQNYYKRAIVVISIYTFLILAVCITGGFNRNSMPILPGAANNISAPAVKADTMPTFRNRTMPNPDSTRKPPANSRPANKPDS